MYVRLHVMSAAKREAVTRVTDEHFKINVREPALRNSANKRALDLLAQQLAVPRQNLRIIHGQQAPHKIVYVRP